MTLALIDRIAAQLQTNATELQRKAAETAQYTHGERLDGREQRAFEYRITAKAMLHTAAAILEAAKAEIADERRQAELERAIKS